MRYRDVHLRADLLRIFVIFTVPVLMRNKFHQKDAMP
jgi:hypothetical protein